MKKETKKLSYSSIEESTDERCLKEENNKDVSQINFRRGAADTSMREVTNENIETKFRLYILYAPYS